MTASKRNIDDLLSLRFRSELRLKQGRIKAELSKAAGWRLRGRQIGRLFVFEDFLQSIKFVNRVAKLAEAMNHHPDITIQYNRVRLILTTHDEGGLTMKDFRLARQINSIKII